MSFYHQALVLAPTDQPASAGLNRVVDLLITSAHEAVRAQQFVQVRELLMVIVVVSPDHVATSSLAWALTVARSSAAARSQQVLAREEVIKTALRAANTALAAGHLTAPAADNALNHFHKALALAPDNAAAQQGLEQVQKALLTNARQLLLSNKSYVSYW